MRKTLTLVALAGMVTLLLPATARAQFEGVITIVVHNPEEGDRTMVQWTMGNRLRLDMSRAASKDGEGPGKTTMIIDRTAKTVTMVMPAQKMFMTTPFTDHKARPANKDEKGEDDQAWTKTGRTETVAGISCDVYHGTGTEDGKKMEGDLCLAKGMGFLVGGVSGSGPMGEAMGGRFAKLGLTTGSGIMKATKNEKGKVRVDLEVTKVEKRSLSASDFQPPAGYQKFQRSH